MSNNVLFLSVELIQLKCHVVQKILNYLTVRMNKYKYRFIHEKHLLNY